MDISVNLQKLKCQFPENFDASSMEDGLFSMKTAADLL